jgi:DNA-binding response OmpR family regulator
MPDSRLSEHTMNAPDFRAALHPNAASLRTAGIDEIVVVDSALDRYEDFVLAAQAGEVGLHFCVDGRSAIRLARRFRADVWLVNGELPDMSGFDLLSMLAPHVMQGSVDPLLEGAAISLDRIGDGMRSGIFIVSENYSLEDEQRALATGVAGYLVRPVTVDLIRNSRIPFAATGAEPAKSHNA